MNAVIVDDERAERLDNVPALIFTTAYDEFAVRAFEANALELVTGLAAARAAIISDSSVESVGEFRLWEPSKNMI
jgi:DNA-binding LytR/AlgR family response regulator